MQLSIKALEEAMQVDCDPVFVETYLNNIPGFKEGVERRNAIAETFQEIGPKVEAVLTGQSALDGLTHVDKPTILATMKDVVDKKLKIKAKDPAGNKPQETLFERSNVQDENRKDERDKKK